MWPLNEGVFYVRIQAAKTSLSDSLLDKQWSENQLWQLGSEQETYIFLRGDVYDIGARLDSASIANISGEWNILRRR